MKMLTYLANAFSIIGAFTLAFHWVILGYACFTLGSIGWAHIAIVKRDNPLLLLNVAFLCANLVGLFQLID